jgi:hypothetical protein
MRSVVQLIGDPSISGVQWALALPWQYPDSPNLYCLEVQMVKPAGAIRESTAGGVEYVGADGKVAKAIYDCVFRVPPFDLLGNDLNNAINNQPFPYSSVRRRTSLEVTKVKGYTLQFRDTVNDGDEPLDEDLSVTTPIMELVFTRHMLPYVPGTAIDAYAGRLNAAEFLGYPAGFVRFGGITSERRIDGGSGQVVNEVEVSFEIKPRDWNTDWSPVAGRGWQLIWSGPSDQVVPYPYADFDAIFNYT